MPLGFERLNERQQRPNPLINFIKPKEGPDKATAEEFLSRIAAQCFPVMKKHYLTVMTLEEYEPNPEFLGRNFNAGEVIQLVLKDKQGRWLSMKFVQMVMMHELAHCKQMNHSRFFWNVRNEYAKQMEDLWREKYTGEGMWGRGRGLDNGAFVNAAPPDNSQIPEHLCGGSYRRRGRKRKRGHGVSTDGAEKLTYAERQQRRIARKFGKHGDGESLGENDLLRGALETMNGGKRGQGKPRVANSKRGRELRAAAALARFGRAKQEVESSPIPDHDVDSETDSEWEYEPSSRSGRDAVVISDDQGRDLVKVCGEGEDDEEGAGQEQDELRMLSVAPRDEAVPRRSAKQPSKGQEGYEDSETESEDELPTKAIGLNSANAVKYLQPDRGLEEAESYPSLQAAVEPITTVSSTEPELLRELDVAKTAPELDKDETTFPPKPTTASTLEAHPPPLTPACPICSLENGPESLTCVACANVLRPKLMPNCWRCKSDTCKESKYINAGDVGRCGLCNAQKPKASASLSDASSGLPIGITRPEVLRWD